LAATPRRHDPQRRARIAKAALDVIAEKGVAGTTHRRVATAADVPLGSTTYHFANLDELLTEAFTLLANTTSASFAEQLAAAQTEEQACEVVADLAMGEGWATERTMILSYELYAYAARNSALRSVMNDWMNKSRAALERHFTAETARILDAMIEGLVIHRFVDPQPMGRRQILNIVEKIIR